MEFYTSEPSKFYPPAIFTPNFIDWSNYYSKYDVVFAPETSIPPERVTIAFNWSKFYSLKFTVHSKKIRRIYILPKCMEQI